MEEEKQCIWPSKCKYDSSDVYPRGSSAANMFSISKISEFGLKGEGRIFSTISEIQNFKNSKISTRIIGGGGKPNWIFLPIFYSFLVTPPLNFSNSKVAFMDFCTLLIFFHVGGDNPLQQR